MISYMQLYIYIFLSTHSKRSATERMRQGMINNVISIHALQAECDSQKNLLSFLLLHFYPRTPSGVRPKGAMHIVDANVNFYPRTPSGVRPDATALALSRWGFLSTHSKRSATNQLMSDNERMKPFLSTHSKRSATV